MPFTDGDNLHPQANIDKMSAGHPLDDADREPWLQLIRTTAEQHAVEQQANPKDITRAGFVVACSSLKKYYRDILRGTHNPEAVSEHHAPPHPSKFETIFVFIKGEKDTLMQRMGDRKGHFMKDSMLNSQLATLETPEGEEGVIVVPLERDTDEQVRIAREQLTALVGPI